MNKAHSNKTTLLFPLVPSYDAFSNVLHFTLSGLPLLAGNHTPTSEGCQKWIIWLWSGERRTVVAWPHPPEATLVGRWSRDEPLAPDSMSKDGRPRGGRLVWMHSSVIRETAPSQRWPGWNLDDSSSEICCISTQWSLIETFFPLAREYSFLWHGVSSCFALIVWFESLSC